MQQIETVQDINVAHNHFAWIEQLKCIIKNELEIKSEIKPLPKKGLIDNTLYMT